MVIVKSHVNKNQVKLELKIYT